MSNTINEEYVPEPHVYLQCQRRWEPYEVACKEFIDVSEDFQGRDEVSFICSHCNLTEYSIVRRM